MRRAVTAKVATELLVALVLLLGFSGACDRSGETRSVAADAPASGASAMTGVTGVSEASGEIRYRLEWAKEHTKTLTDGAGWVVENDLGYRVTVERGYLVSYSAELVECGGPRPIATATPVASLSATDVWRALSFVGEAWAGHGSVAPNPAAVRVPHVESLSAPQPQEFGTTRPGAWRYCQVHYLVARAPRESVGLPAETDMVDASLFIEGRYRAPGASSDTPFQVRTSIANGKLSDIVLSGASAGARVDGSAARANEVDTGVENAEVTIRRDLGTLFDGIDFAKLAERDVARQMLKNLIASTSLVVTREKRDA